MTFIGNGLTAEFPVYGEWTDAVTDEDYDNAADKFLADYPECSSWNIYVEEQKGEEP